jgi:hypothetical protein
MYLKLLCLGGFTSKVFWFSVVPFEGSLCTKIFVGCDTKRNFISTLMTTQLNLLKLSLHLKKTKKKKKNDAMPWMEP